MEADSVIDVTQIATVDRVALEERICVLPDWTIAQVDAGLGRADISAARLALARHSIEGDESTN